MEHHSNIVPWQILCEEKQAILRIAPINQRGELLLDEFEKLLGPAHQAGFRRACFERLGHH
jgi:cysteine desulfurase/selenocysteine lyase